MRLGIRLLFSFIMVSIIPIAFLVVGGLKTIIQLNELSISKTSEETEKFLHDMIQQKARDVATQIEISLKTHPELNSIEMYRAHPEFRSFAIQRVGKVGYTALVAPDGYVILHPDPTIEGQNMLTNPPRKLYPDFIELYKKALNSTAAHGYYTWPEQDGTIKRKYLATYKTHNDMVVFATAYIDDMYQPLANTHQEILHTQAEIIKSKLTLLGTLAVFIATMTGISVYISIIKPIKRIKLGIAAFSEGDYSYRIPLSSSTDELNTVAALLNQFSEQLDITARELKKETERLTDSEARYRALIENINQPLMLVDNTNSITYINPAFTRTLGYTPDEAIGNEFSYFVHQEDLGLLKRRAGYSILRNRKNFQAKLRAKHKQGYFVMFEINASLVYSRDKKLAYVVVLGQDITETHKLHRELETANLILNQVETGIALFTTDGRITFSNQQWAKIHGYSDCYEFQHQPLSMFFPPRAAENVEQSFLSALHQTPTLNELSHLKRDGSEIEAITTFSPFHDSSGETIGVICSTCDVTEYRQKPQELQNKIDILEQKLSEIDRELESALIQLSEAESLKTEFLSTISHELRTPLNAIVGFSKYLLEKVPPTIIEKHGAELEHVYQNSLYLHDLISSVLELTNLDSGNATVDPTEFSLPELIQEVIAFTKNVYLTKHLEIRNRTLEEDIRVVADRAKVKRILLSLLSNAVKFTYAGEVLISAQQSERETRVEIMDTGVGIPEADREQIFERFVQLAEPMPGQFFGTGLGLTLAKAYVELHGGEIDFSPNPEAGVTFWFTIPRHDTE